jgi:SPP1 gp7 family putative phage head morphogenesis protein
VKIPLWGGRQLELSRQSAPDTSGNEQGSSGDPADGYFLAERNLGGIRNPTIEEIMQMIDNDGTAAALYNVVTFPVLASDWHIEPDPEDVIKVTNADGTETETHPQADFVEAALRNPEHKGGMSTPFSLVLANMLLAVAQGYRFFEIVYKLNDQGQVVFKKVVARRHNEIKILTDETGGFAGVEQRVKKGGQTQTIKIELPYCFLFTYKPERRPLKGASAFRAAFYHYDKKHRLYFLQHQQAQVNAMGFKTLESPEDSKKEDRDANLKEVDRMAVRPSIALPFGWKLTVQQPAKGIDLNTGIDGHDVQMARSFLAQGMLLGNQSASTGGSYALAESHMDLFMLGEMALMSSIEEHITSFMISKLIDYNFDKPMYPTFRFNALNDDVTNLLREAFKGLVSKGAVPKWVAQAISDRVAEQMQIEKPEDADESLVGGSSGGAAPGQGNDPNANDGGGNGNGDGGDNNDPGNGDSKQGTQQQSRSSKKKELSTGSDWWRELTKAEAKVQFAKIQKQADADEASMRDSIKPLFDKLADDTTKRLKPILQGDNVSKAMDGFSLNFADELRKTMVSNMVATYSAAKNQCADEIKKKAPGNKQASKDLMTQHVQSIVDKQYSDMLFNIKAIVTDAVRKNLLAKTELSIGDVLTSVLGMFSDFYDSKEPLTVSSLITTAINIGRDDVFQEYESDVYGYQYSAILDEAVCPICEELDGSVATEAEYYSTKWMPPIHFNCRCIWVAIMQDEEDKPPFTGIPETPGGASEPLLAFNHIDENSLSASVEYQLYLRKVTEALWLQKRR